MVHDTVPLPEPSSPTHAEMITVLQEQSRAIDLAPRRSRGRPADLSWMQICMGVLVCVLRGWEAQLDLWRLLCAQGLWHWQPVRQITDQAVYNRLDRAVPWMQQLFEQISRQLRDRLSCWQEHQLAPFAREVLALDESTLDEVGRWLPELRQLAAKDARLLAGRISALFDVRRQQWWKVDLLPDALTNCKVHARAMIQELAAGTLVLFDRGYCAFEWYDDLTERGLFWISRYSNAVSYQIRHVCYSGDGVLDAIVTLGNYRRDQARYPVRLLQFWYQGRHYRYLTNVCDPHLLPLADVVRLYARRWDIELGFRLLKDHLHFRFLQSAKWSVIQVQLWASLLLAQVFHALQQEIAHQAGVSPQDVSLDLLVRLTPQLLWQGIDPVAWALRWGRDLLLIRTSSRTRYQVPFVDPAWVQPPPDEALCPRTTVHHSHRKCQSRTKPEVKAARPADQGPRVLLRGGILVAVHPNLLE